MTFKDIIDGLFEQAQSILIAAVFLLVIFAVVQTFLRTRSWVPTLGALLVGAVALWGVNSIEALSQTVDNTVRSAGDSDSDGDLGDIDTDGLDGGADEPADGNGTEEHGDDGAEADNG